MRTIGGHNRCLVIADGSAPEADAIVFTGTAPQDARLLVQDVGDDAISGVADLLLLRGCEITHRQLIERCALTGVPTLLCTRGSSLKEISRAVGWHQLAFRTRAEQTPDRQRAGIEGGGRLILLHGGPNLRAIARIHEQTLMPVGHEGDESEALAVAAGACVLLRPADDGFAAAVKSVREAEERLGEPRASKLAGAMRRIIVASRDMKSGERLRQTDLVFRVAGAAKDGLEPFSAEDILGRELVQDVREGEAILTSMMNGKSPNPPAWFAPRPPRTKPT